MKYPLNKLRGIGIKREIREHLVVPVCESGDRTRAFRVIWRVSGDDLAHAWDTIVSNRRLCDEVVARTEALQTFVSCISGVFNKAGRCRGEVKPVYPAVSYWAVSDATTADGSGEMVQRLMATFPHVQVKEIKPFLHGESQQSIAANCEMLFVALKDHRGGFVNEKINRSLVAGGYAVGCANVNSSCRNARLVVKTSSRYLRQYQQSIGAIQAAGLCIAMLQHEAGSIVPTALQDAQL